MFAAVCLLWICSLQAVSYAIPTITSHAPLAHTRLGEQKEKASTRENERMACEDCTHVQIPAFLACPGLLSG